MIFFKDLIPLYVVKAFVVKVVRFFLIPSFPIAIEQRIRRTILKRDSKGNAKSIPKKVLRVFLPNVTFTTIPLNKVIKIH
ncbi:hypothetical protein SAMN04487911_12348 [Arenibacter nanhaiticus]|uniref:Uncharacterized protein n=1 Tax=Arenibacter nanhaiticus TaxID=558155 RepID=A0A1M6JWY3_9FLAO|nr:hypothetical protein SAMN04487911_12348 [Arenibacter nanhaiticus]